MKTTLIVCDFSDMTMESARYFEEMISPDRRSLISESRKGGAYIQSIVATGLLEEFLSSEGYHDVSYRYSDIGKPYLDMAGAPFFSISHSANYAAVAVSCNPIGVDIEALSAHKNTDIPRISKRFFTQGEADWIGDDRDRFLRAWTYKEACAKARDESLSSNLDKWEYKGITGQIKEFEIDDKLFWDGRFGKSFNAEPTEQKITFFGTDFIGCLVDSET